MWTRPGRHPCRFARRSSTPSPRHEGVDPVDLTPPLYDAIDTDALDKLVATTSTSPQADLDVTFTYQGYNITVADGGVTVEERDE